VNKEVLAIIPARGNSKAIPNKNIVDLLGAPLVSYSIKAALESSNISRVICSTNSKKIADVAVKFGAECPYLRPDEFSNDAIHSVHTVTHALKWLMDNEGYRPDIVVMLLPTSPFRTSEHIDGAIETFYKESPDSVVSVYENDKQLLHFRYIEEGKLVAVEEHQTLNVQRQSLRSLYALNGSIYVATPDTVLEKESFHLTNTRPYIMPSLNSIDINEPEDLEMARLIGKNILNL
jgi:CMP-N,N'-diacetyllegionaminic acid synthase